MLVLSSGSAEHGAMTVDPGPSEISWFVYPTYSPLQSAKPQEFVPLSRMPQWHPRNPSSVKSKWRACVWESPAFASVALEARLWAFLGEAHGVSFLAGLRKGGSDQALS